VGACIDTGSGDCLVLRGIIAIPGVPLACGSTTGKSWDTSARDGCDWSELVDCCGAVAGGSDSGPGRRE
jgi:hypothetical protein